MDQEKSDSPADIEIDKRPIGVWILTIFAGVMKGLFPLAFIFLVILSKDSTLIVSLSPLALIGNIGLGAGILGSAIAAWRGSNSGRILLLIFVTLVYSLVAYNNYQEFVSAYISKVLTPLEFARVLRGVLFPALYIWYFTQHKTIQFYKPGEGLSASAE